MLSRHFLRSLVLQNLYACHIAPTDYTQLEHSLTNHIDLFNSLGIMQLSMLPALRHAAEGVIEDGLRKFRPTETERNPSRRLVENRFLLRLEENFDLKKFCDQAKIRWDNEIELFRKAYFDIRNSEVYLKYINDANDSFDTDKQMALQLFKYLVNDEALRSNISDRGLLWEDNFDQIAQYNFMMLKTFDDTFDAATPLPVMYDIRFEKDIVDINFAKTLLRATYDGNEESDAMISKNLRGWDLERVALMDIIIIKMAIAELTTCETIPERVTIDEYIELAKEFSTDRSKLFVNGIIDRLITELRAAGRINKTGRGLAFDNADADNNTPDADTEC